jgi:hypothetical protein
MEQETLVTKAIHAIVDAGELAGAIMLNWRAGQVIQVGCIGWRCRGRKLSLQIPLCCAG